MDSIDETGRSQHLGSAIVTPLTKRLENEALVLKLVDREAVDSAVEIRRFLKTANRAGLSSVEVADALDGLLDRGLLIEADDELHIPPRQLTRRD